MSRRCFAQGRKRLLDRRQAHRTTGNLDQLVAAPREQTDASRVVDVHAQAPAVVQVGTSAHDRKRFGQLAETTGPAQRFAQHTRLRAELRLA